MTGRTLHAMTAAAGMALAACANSATHTKEAAMATASASAAALSIPVKEWPLHFESHNFDVRCYDTLECRVDYANFEHEFGKPTAPSARYGPGYLDNWRGGQIGIRNFPPPARVAWRSKDGQEHEAEIDIGALFSDGVIRHNVSREEMADLPDGEYQSAPNILLEVNDRTIRVYMRAHVPTRRLQKPGNQYSDFRNDLILVNTHTY